MIQDEDQMRVYESKSAQIERWSSWMPDTWRFTEADEAVHFLESAGYPLVSKADVGASSVNVRILENAAQAIQHVRQIFGKGIEVDHCSGSAKSLQRGYVILQRFIPHTTTWRVNAIGNARAAFMRYCYKDRPVAQTGNVEPVMTMTPQIESLFEYSNRFFAEAGTKWCAIDVLEDNGTWRLLESSLAWPWPSPGECNSGPIFGSKHKWIGMFDAMFDEYEAGAWA
jgi:biotin carboxylase